MTTTVKFTDYVPSRCADLILDQIEALQKPNIGVSEVAASTEKLLDGVLCLTTLANNVNKTTRGAFLDFLKDTVTQIENIRYKDEKPSGDLSFRVAQIYIDVVKLEEYAFTKFYSLTTQEKLNLQSKQIEEIRLLNPNQKIQQMLSIVEGKIVDLKRIAIFFQTETAVKTSSNIKSSPEAAIRSAMAKTSKPIQHATRNMYSREYDQFYGEESFKGKAALPTVLHYLQEKLCGTTNPSLDEIIIKGQITTANLLREDSSTEATEAKENENFQINFSMLVKTEEFNKSENTRAALKVQLLNGQTAFKLALNELAKILDEQPEDSMAFIISARGERFGLYMQKKQDTSPTVTFFDPQGDSLRFRNYFPYSEVFTSFEEAAKVLAQRLPITESFRREVKYNEAIITAFKIDSSKVYSPTQLTTPQVQEVQPKQEFSNRALIASCYSLLTALDNAGKEDAAGQTDKDSLKASYDALKELMKENCLFSMTETENKSIGDRPFFQLYHMHAKEAPQKLVDDLNYGSNAFQNAEKTTLVERARCIQRTIIEVALSGLELAIQENDADGTREFLNVLEGLNLDALDLPKDQKNLAHSLFGSLYNNYLKAWQETPSIISPYEHCFGTDFGRIAFRDEAEHKIPAQFKLDVLSDVKEALKTIWF